MRTTQLLLTCEHGGRRIPREYRRLFRAAARDLASHRGWDPGALDVARGVARRLRLPLIAAQWSRLLVDPNRSPSNPRIWSAYTKGLCVDERERILARYWWPHRRAVESAVEGLVGRGFRVVHVAVHSFTPRLAGEHRRADVGLLYDPARAGEVRLCTRWQRILEELEPGPRIRRNQPYRGAADGLTTWLRRHLPERSYAGVELELNQALLARRGPAPIAALVAQSLEDLLRAGARARASGSTGRPRAASRRRGPGTDRRR